MYFLYFYVKYVHMAKKPTNTEITSTLKKIGVKIRTHRKTISKNYEDFAREHDFNKVTISRIENGENFTMSSLIQVLRVLDVSLEEFFQGIK